MKFLTPAFVRVENSQERKELIGWLESIGWLRASDIEYVGLDKGIVCLYGGTHYDLWSDAIEDFPAGIIYDCDTNIPLFKALAAMNDENDRQQWFIVEWATIQSRFHHGDMYLCKGDRAKLAYCGIRKATSEEIIEHFKNQQL